ncbi:hypothetical protein AB4090_03880 [Acidithiobacillus sp. IBUN Pt1247-S3]|uniref:hypothetical protein n=1 Tax=Acidithiobacillus sp. IBUN Pt1247-S3 TaxID=3166642 RepID=UPI0034E418C2
MPYAVMMATGGVAYFVIGSADEHIGIHTIPLGLAVLSSALAFLVHGEDLPMLFTLAEALLALNWLLTIFCVSQLSLSLYQFGIPW